MCCCHPLPSPATRHARHVLLTHAVHTHVSPCTQAYVIGEEGLVEELTAAGIQCVGGPEHRGKEVDWSQDEPHIDVDPEVR